MNPLHLLRSRKDRWKDEDFSSSSLDSWEYHDIGFRICARPRDLSQEFALLPKWMCTIRDPYNLLASVAL